MTHEEYFNNKRELIINDLLKGLHSQDLVKEMLLKAYHAGRQSVFSQLAFEREAIVKLLTGQE